jgi:predicted acyltransferase
MAGERFDALDILRGLAVAGMILVTSPGDWASAYPPLLHADWDGATLADMVFPTFLFSVGLALGLSLPRPFAPADRSTLWARVGRRVVLLIVLGLLLETTYIAALALGGGGPGVADLAHMRLPGIPAADRPLLPAGRGRARGDRS